MTRRLDGKRRSDWNPRGRRGCRGGYLRVDVGCGVVKMAHVMVAEAALGHALPLAAEIHHANDDTADNRNRNLVICQDATYHKQLHARRRVLRAGGDPFTDRICGHCRQVKPITMFTPNQRTCFCCNRDRMRRRRSDLTNLPISTVIL